MTLIKSRIFRRYNWKLLVYIKYYLIIKIKLTMTHSIISYFKCYPHSMAYCNEGDYNYWGSYNFQPNQPVATNYSDYQNPAVQHSYNNNGCNMFYYEPGGFYSQPPQSKPKPVHTCDVCKKTFNYPYALQRHKKRKVT